MSLLEGGGEERFDFVIVVHDKRLTQDFVNQVHKAPELPQIRKHNESKTLQGGFLSLQFNFRFCGCDKL